MGSPADHWPLTTGDDVRDELLRAYGDPARGYHDTRHLTEVLTRLDELADPGTTFDRTPVLLAAWFHDAVYDGERTPRSARPPGRRTPCPRTPTPPPWPRPLGWCG